MVQNEEVNNHSSQKVFSEPTLRRMPVYYSYLKKIAEQGIHTVSCTQIASDLNLIAILVRKDLETTNILGKPKIGYYVPELISAIEKSLGWNNSTDAFLAGVGNLGAALLGYQGFKDYGLNVIAAFDIDQSKVGTEINGKKVLHISKLPRLVARMNVKIGILTAPSGAAQEVAELMVQGGIKAIWNFAPARIIVPQHIIVQHENLASSLAVLSKKLTETIK